MIGYIGRITERDVERIEEAGNAANYRGSQHMGKAGLEQSYEHELHGTTGFEQVEVNAGGRGAALSHTAATPGNDLELTLDIELQKVAEKAFGDRRGALVAIEPATGGVLALASMPTYDPNLFVDGIDPGLEGAQRFARPSDAAPRDLPTYPPGSTFKPFMALAGLRPASAPRAGQAIHDVGYFQFGGHRFMDDKIGGHGMVDLQVDRGVVHVLLLPARQRPRHRGHRRLHGALRLRRAHRHRPARRKGHRVLPSPEWKRKHLQEARAAALVRRRDDLGRHRPGLQRLTPLQLANALAALVSQGVVPPARGHVRGRFAHWRATRGRTRAPLRQIRRRDAHLKAVLDAMVATSTARAPARRVQAARPTPSVARPAPRRCSRCAASATSSRVREMPARPLLVRRLRPGREPEDRARGAGRERRLRRPVGGADRAPGDRLLPARPAPGAPAAEDEGGAESEEAAEGSGEGARRRRRARDAGGGAAAPGNVPRARPPARPLVPRPARRGEERAMNDNRFNLPRSSSASCVRSTPVLMLVLAIPARLRPRSCRAPRRAAWIRQITQHRHRARRHVAARLAQTAAPAVDGGAALPLGVVLLLAVELFGEVSGAQRWLDVGVARIQPSELMKIAMPLMLAWFFQMFIDFLRRGALLLVRWA